MIISLSRIAPETAPMLSRLGLICGRMRFFCDSTKSKPSRDSVERFLDSQLIPRPPRPHSTGGDVDRIDL